MRSFAFAGAAFVSILVACSDNTNDAPTIATNPSGSKDAGTTSSGAAGDAGAGNTGDDDDASGPIVGENDSGTQGNPGADSGTTGDDAGQSGDDDTSDSGTTTKPDASSGGTDGTPTRDKCTNTYGKALTGSFGRIDGYVVSIVAPSSSSNCNGDTTHIHIQVSMNGDVYDVAVNVDGGYVLQKDVALPNAAWSEGWHVDGLDYSSDLGIHTADFTTVTQSALVTELENALASANHITAYGTTYTGSDVGSGIHDIHFESTNKDGAIFLDPTASSAHGYFFHFKGDSF